MKEKSRNTEELDLIRKDGQQGLTLIYRRYRDPFLMFCKRFRCPTELHLEAYHDAILGLNRMIKENRYDPESASIKTLLFAIGKKSLLNKIRKEKRFSRDVEILEGTVNQTQLEFNKSVWGTEENRIEQAMQQLSASCRQLIVLFYYHRYSINAIHNEMGHANENVTKSHKSRCMKKLKEIFKTINK